MVSNARLDLPEPESPVTTTSWSRGISSEMFLRLWTRAPCTAIVVRAAAAGFRDIDKRQLLHGNRARFREPDRRRGLGDEAAIGQVLAGAAHTRHIEMPL